MGLWLVCTFTYLEYFMHCITLAKEREEEEEEEEGNSRVTLLHHHELMSRVKPVNTLFKNC